MKNENVGDGEERRKETRNKNTNRNKVEFAFDKHRKKAQCKVIPYTSTSYDLHRPLPRPGIYLVCHSSSRNPALAISSTTESRSSLRKNDARNGRRIADYTALGII